MAFPGRPAHDFSSPYSRAPAGRFSFTAPCPPPRGVGPFPFFSGPLSAVGRAGAWWMRGSVLSGRGGL